MGNSLLINEMPSQLALSSLPSSPSLLDLFLRFFFCVALLSAFLLVVRRIYKKHSTGRLQFVEELRLSTHHVLYVVACDGKQLLLAGSAHGLSLLRDLSTLPSQSPLNVSDATDTESSHWTPFHTEETPHKGDKGVHS